MWWIFRMAAIGTGPGENRPRAIQRITYDSAKAFRAWVDQCNIFNAIILRLFITFTPALIPEPLKPLPNRYFTPRHVFPSVKISASMAADKKTYRSAELDQILQAR